MSWFVNRVWPKCRATVVVGIVAWAVLEPSGMAWATEEPGRQWRRRGTP